MNQAKTLGDLRQAGYKSRSVKAEMRENLIASVRANRCGEGTLMMSGHFGNWELLAQLTGHLAPLTVLGRRMRAPWLDELVMQLRQRSGNEMIYQDAGMRPCIAALRSGRFMATLPDQDIQRLGGCFVPWFGHLAYTPHGPALLAILSRTPITPIYCYRRAKRWVMHVGPRRWPRRDLPRDEAAAELTAWTMAYQEQLVRRHPEQWVWWHKRRRTQPTDKPDSLCWVDGQAKPAS